MRESGSGLPVNQYDCSCRRTISAESVRRISLADFSSLFLSSGGIRIVVGGIPRFINVEHTVLHTLQIDYAKYYCFVPAVVSK
jgi:hypothetical protein